MENSLYICDKKIVFDLAGDQFQTIKGDRGPQGDPGAGIAEGGTTGQVLVKRSDEDYDTEWTDPGDASTKVDDVTVNGVSVVTDKIAEVIVPEKVSDLQNDSNFATEDYVESYHDSTKQDSISDLETIRSGAALGATALQSFTETDPVYSASPAAGITTAKMNSWDSKATADSVTAVGTRVGVVEGLLDGHSVGKDVPADAKFTDTVYDDTVLAGRVTTIEGKIPSQATAQNQLADKAFVNSTVGTNTAIFRGTYSTLAELQAQEATNNDYGFVTRVDTGNTYYDRYKFNGTAWVFEYSINNSSFTAAQWAAIQSGITADTVEGIGNHIADSDIHVTAAQKTAWSGKQDAITDLESIRSGAALGATALQSFTETDPVFAASAAHGISASDITNWNGKQAAISDLSTIRTQASEGHTAYTMLDGVEALLASI